MKNKILILLLLNLINYLAIGQNDYKLIAIKNNNFPKIRVYLRAKGELNLDSISFSENNDKLSVLCDTIEGEAVNSASNLILFVLKQNCDKKISDLLIKAIKGFSHKEKINIAYILNNDTSKKSLYYLSSNFSNNHEFFINALKHNVVKNINVPNTEESKKSIKLIEKNMIKDISLYSNKGAILLVNNFNFTPIKTIFKDKSIPKYALLLQKVDSISRNKLSKICSESKGRYTETKYSNASELMESYLEEIYLEGAKTTHKIFMFTFKSKQNKKNNSFKIKYFDEIKLYSFEKPQKPSLSKREQFLILISSVLFLILLFLIFKGRKKITSQTNSKELIQTQFLLANKTIEINVKTKGFNKTYFFEKHLIRIGRGEDNDIIIPDRTVSVSHALINRDKDGFLIQDLGSTNGVSLNQEKIKKQRLKSNDKIILGASVLIVRV